MIGVVKKFCTVASLLIVPVSGLANDHDVNATFGSRLGEESVESYLDFIVPVLSGEQNLLFFNPRFSIADAGQTEFNVGLGYRQIFRGAFMLGANVFYDSRYTQYNNRLNQFGAGIELLSTYVDSRLNYYDADNDPQLINSFITETEKTELSYRDTTYQYLDYSSPYATGHSIAYDQTITNITNRKTTTTKTLIQQWYDEFEIAMDGWDFELGFKIPNRIGPEMRIFAGYYDYDNPINGDFSGVKGRFELRTGSHLTFDAEVFEDDGLNESNYFLGFRLNIPLHGRHTWGLFGKV